MLYFKGTVRVISSAKMAMPDLQPYTLVALADQVWIITLFFENCLFWSVVSLQKWNEHFLFVIKIGDIHKINTLRFTSKRNDVIFHICDQTVVNRALSFLHGGSLTLTVPLNLCEQRL